MIILDVTQMSDEWFAARVSNPGASSFDKIVTSTGAPSKQSKAYLYQLAGEAIVGVKTETYQNPAMLRGIELEQEAREFYEFIKGVEVQQVGLCYPDDKKQYHCSPDALINEDGGLEIKCPLIHTHVEYLLGGKIPTKYIQQVQGSLLVTGRKWWDFLSYYPGMKPFLIRVERDTKFIAKLRNELSVFTDNLSKTIQKLKEL